MKRMAPSRRVPTTFFLLLVCCSRLSEATCSPITSGTFVAADRDVSTVRRRLEAPTPPPTQAPASDTTSARHNHQHYNSFLHWSFVVPVLSISIMAWAFRKTKVILCCVDEHEIPDEIVVPIDDDDDCDVNNCRHRRDCDSVVGERNNPNDIEMQPPKYWRDNRSSRKKTKQRHDLKAHRQQLRWQQHRQEELERPSSLAAGRRSTVRMPVPDDVSSLKSYEEPHDDSTYSGFQLMVE